MLAKNKVSTNTVENTEPIHHSPIPLTFGVELEFLFGYNPELIKKEETPEFHYLLDETIQRDPEDGGPAGSSQVDITEKAATIVRKSGKRVIISHPKEASNYKAWSLCEEGHSSLSWSHGAKSRISQLGTWTQGVWTAQNNDLWKSQGLELVSPPLDCPEVQYFIAHGLDEVKQILASTELRTHPSPYFFIANPITAGLHIHIGCKPDATGYADGLPVTVLQHLAFITLLYEDVITLLHHPERRGFWDTKSAGIAHPNRYGLVNVPRVMHACFQPDEAFKSPVGEQIFEEDISRRKLASIMSSDGHYNISRYKFVNWLYVADDRPEKPTVEFRQHHGTLDYNEIEQWVVFVTALVRTAEKFAAMPVPPPLPISTSDIAVPEHLQWDLGQVRKYPTLSPYQAERLLQLLELMDLPQERRKYWLDRAEEWKKEKYTSFGSYNECLECDYEKRAAKFEESALLRTAEDSTDASSSFNYGWGPVDDVPATGDVPNWKYATAPSSPSLDWSLAANNSTRYMGNQDDSHEYSSRSEWFTGASPSISHDWSADVDPAKNNGYSDTANEESRSDVEGFTTAPSSPVLDWCLADTVTEAISDLYLSDQ